MFVILGATEHVGSAVAKTLLDVGQAVRAVTRDELPQGRDAEADPVPASITRG